MATKKGEVNVSATTLVAILLAVLLFLVFIFGLKSKIGGLIP